MFLKYTVAVVCGCVLSAVIGAPANAADFTSKPFGVSLTSDITYTTVNLNLGGTADIKLDLYEPNGAGVPTLKPAFIMCHGGGFAVNSKTNDATEFPPSSGMFINSSITDYAMEFAKRGYVVVSIDYPKVFDYGGTDYALGTGYLTGISADLAAIAAAQDGFLSFIGAPNPLPQAQHINTIEAAIQATVDAAQYLTTNAASLGIDPARIAIGGWSAGALMAFHAKDAGANVAAAWLNSGGALGVPAATVVDATTPPMIQFHGASDTIVLLAQGIDVRDALIAQPTTHEFYQMPAPEDHFYFLGQTVTVSPSRAVPDTIENLIADFMFTNLNLAPLVSVSPSVPVAHPWALIALVSFLGLAGLCAVGKRLVLNAS